MRTSHEKQEPELLMRTSHEKKEPAPYDWPRIATCKLQEYSERQGMVYSSVVLARLSGEPLGYSSRFPGFRISSLCSTRYRTCEILANSLVSFAIGIIRYRGGKIREAPLYFKILEYSYLASFLTQRRIVDLS